MTTRYANAKVYKLVNTVDDHVYIGSTCLRLSKRKSSHKQSAQKSPNQKVYRHLNNIDWNNVRIILIENSVSSKEELLARELRF